MRLKLFCSTLLSLGVFSNQAIYADPFFKAVPENKAPTMHHSALLMRSSKMDVYDTHVYTVDAQSLTEKTASLELNITPELTLYADKVTATNSASGGLLWTGSVSTSSDKTSSTYARSSITSDAPLATQSVTLVNRNGNITGTVRTENQLFKISPLGNGSHLVVEIDQDNMKLDHPPGAMEDLESQLVPQAIISSNESGSASITAADPVIRVMVLYSNGVPGEVNDIPGLIDLAIAETNQGYINSGVNAKVELAHLGATDYSERGISTDLNRLKRTNDGYMDDVHALRDQHAADIVMLIVPDNGSACGQAAAIGATEKTAFAVTAQDCATGYYSFGHELGHLQSARHNPQQDNSTRPYAFGHGYQDPDKNWRTVMSYNCSGGCSRINWWSNPSKTRDGNAMGTTRTSNNTRVLNITASTVAGFRGDSTPPSDSGLKNGVAETSLQASQGTDLRFTMDVPAGASNLQFTISGGTGDADLYVRYESAPTDDLHDCRPYQSGNNETCTMDTKAGTYHVRVKAYSAFSGLSLTGSYTD